MLFKFNSFIGEIESFLHGRGKFLSECLREEDEDEDASDQWAGAHDDQREGAPHSVQESYLRSDDPSNPATEGATTHSSTPDLGGEQLGGVDEHDGETGGGSELADERESNLKQGVRIVSCITIFSQSLEY